MVSKLKINTNYNDMALRWNNAIYAFPPVKMVGWNIVVIRDRDEKAERGWQLDDSMRSERYG